MKGCRSTNRKWNKAGLRAIWCLASLALTIFWGMMIFGFSAQEGEKSSDISGRISYAIADELKGMAKQEMSEADILLLAEKMEHPIRKCAHMMEYAFFALLIFNLFSAFGMKGKKRYLFVIIVVLIYAITDEVHQLYVPGRSGQATDVIIDVLGGSLMMLVVSLVLRRFTKRRDLRHV